MKKILSFMLILAILFCALPISMVTVNAETSGKCGSNAYWTYNETANTLTISGSGDMYDYNNWSDSPLPTANTVIIGDNITRIGKNAFAARWVRNLKIGKSVNSIGELAFYDACLQSVTIPGNVKTIESQAFWYNDISNVILEEGVEYIDARAFCHCKIASVVIPKNAKRFAFAFDDDVTLYIYKNSNAHRTIVADGSQSYLSVVLIENDSPTITTTEEQIKSMVGNIDLGPYAIKGATINLFGNEISLIDIEAKIKLNIGDFKVVYQGEAGTVQVLLGYDNSASANISGEKNSTTYWSESYKEVKSMYQSLTGKKVDTTRIWNKYSSLRSKLKKINGNLVVDVSYDYAGYLEFKNVNGKLQFSEGGVMASFNADTSLRSYYGPCYVALGIGVDADGTLAFVNENNKANLKLSLDTSLLVSASAGLGGRNTYAEAGAYGSLGAIIKTDSEEPFTAYADLGIRWQGFLFGKEVFSDSKSLAKVELYPNFGESMLRTRSVLLASEINVSNKESYNELINSAQTINRSYLDEYDTKLSSKLNLRATLSEQKTTLQKFEITNAFPLNEPQLVNFNDDTCLLVWIDDLGTKSDENMCSLMYSYYDGTSWSTPTTIYENGTNIGMPSVYSDGIKAYIVWQKASVEFNGSEETSEMLEKYDLYATVFDVATQTFSQEILINDTANTVFEMTPEIYGSNGEFSVVWLENSDNNIYGQSGTSKIFIAKYDANGIKTQLEEVFSTNDIISGLQLNKNVYYSVLSEEKNTLYQYNGITSLIADSIEDFSIDSDKAYYLSGGTLNCYDGIDIVNYSDFVALDNINIVSNEENTYLFSTVLNEDFTKMLYYCRLQSDNTWTDLENYTDGQYFIRNYSPIIDSTGEVYIAFNNIDVNSDTECEKSILTVDGKTDSVDIQLNYIDFDNAQLNQTNLELKYNVKNNSSVTVKGLLYEIYDSDNNLILSGSDETTIDSFGECELSLQCKTSYIIGKQLKLIVKPMNYFDYALENNEVLTTIECAHRYTEIRVLPTNTTSGKTIYKCDYCADAFEEDILEQPALKLSGATLTLYNDISVNYLVKKEIIDDSVYTNPYIMFEFCEKQYKVSDYIASGDYYAFAFNNISPDKMNDTIKATLYANVGDTVLSSEAKEYSVSTYCYSMLSKYNTDQYAELRTLLVDLLNYGSDTQNYTDYNTDNLVNANLTDEQKAWASVDIESYNNMLNTKYETIESPAVSWRGAELLLDKAITMKFMIKAENISNLNVKITNDAGKVWTVKSDTFKKYDEGQYYVYFSGLDASQMSDCIYLTVYNGERVVSNTVRYSIESYASSKQNSTDEKLVKLISSMMKYGKSAYNYKN
ncbi:MAG: leucine-rich repeat domain-containing protein [Clostridia bacterium]|nr:leucine-rich repeat domain-containing protein [Clostridia bacterium]